MAFVEIGCVRQLLSTNNSAADFATVGNLRKEFNYDFCK